MSMQIHYEINVSLNGKHFFATDERSTRDEAPTKKLVAEFRARFPESEGFKIDVTHWQASGTKITF